MKKTLVVLVVITFSLSFVSCKSHWNTKKLDEQSQALIDRIEVQINNSDRAIDIDSIRFTENGTNEMKLPVFIATITGTEWHSKYSYQTRRIQKTTPQPFESKFMMSEQKDGSIVWNGYDIVKNIWGLRNQ